MKTDAILNADVLDIIFENRNKSYGAYYLRKFYNNRLYKAMGVTFSFAAVLFALSFIQKEKVLPAPYIADPYVISCPIVPLSPVPEKPKEHPTPQQPATAKIKPPTQVLANNIQITKDDLASKIQDFKDNIQIGNENTKGDPGAPLLVGEKIPEGPETHGLPETTKPSIDVSTPVGYAEVMPQFPGGMAALRKFLEKNLRNPQDIDEGQEVVVKIRFIVGYDGTLKGFETIQDGGKVFNNEVMRVLRKMPQWIPGKTKGENVSVYYIIPVNFKGVE
ncbi:MAG: energy transducer TonB [Ferruginibacter sp.]